MKNKILGLVFILCGVALIVGGVIAEIAWLAFCFGTVIVGILLLFFMPIILLAPLTFGWAIGIGLIDKGFELIE